ncbi:MAG TPA: protein translocase subunit SecF, partial [Roseiflexaceae bacterium]|nr:protein translocase subunit SecF [Roseiflexaceae bacterium]
MNSFVRLRYLWLLISVVVIVPGAISFALFGLRLGIDFSGGALWDLQFVEQQPGQISSDTIRSTFESQGFEGAQVQLTTATIDGREVAGAIVRTRALSATDPNAQLDAMIGALSGVYGETRRAALQSVGATVSAESTRSAVIAVLGACLAILVYLTLAFRRAPHPIRYGICAILAMIHDVLVVLGLASILGQTIGLEVDALFL